MNAGNKNTSSMHQPRRCDYLNGWIKNTDTCAKISPKMVNPRDINNTVTYAKISSKMVNPRDRLETRRERKTVLNNSRTRAPKAKAQEEYKAADREVNRSIKKDKRDYIDD